MKAIKKGGWALEYASSELQNDKKIYVLFQQREHNKGFSFSFLLMLII